MSSEVYPLDLWTSIFALKHSILIALGLPPFDEVCEPFFLDRRDGEDPVTDVGGSGRFLWGSQDPSLDSSYPDPLSSSSLESCDLGSGGFFAFLATFWFWFASRLTVCVSSAICSSNADVSLWTRRTARARAPAAPGDGVIKPLACPSPPSFSKLCELLIVWIIIASLLQYRWILLSLLISEHAVRHWFVTTPAVHPVIV